MTGEVNGLHRAEQCLPAQPAGATPARTKGRTGP